MRSFIATPSHCGSIGLGYRPTAEFAGPRGISLGTVAAISGVAANASIGYHTSPALAFLLTLFNVRLGWWLGNPRNDHTYRRSDPASSLRPLLAEALGMADSAHPYVHLSDGRHFEGLGFYEMVVRRCRNIIIVGDAAVDVVIA